MFNLYNNVYIQQSEGTVTTWPLKYNQNSAAKTISNFVSTLESK